LRSLAIVSSATSRLFAKPLAHFIGHLLGVTWLIVGVTGCGPGKAAPVNSSASPKEPLRMNAGNYRFSFEEWLPRVPLEPKYKKYSGEVVTGPRSFVNNELLRRELTEQYNWGPSVAMDVFVFSKGEAPDRHVTKLGGLPFRPAREPWPVTDLGEPLTFLAQINFHDSHDITGRLPGDILLVFVEFSRGNLIKSAQFEWQSAELTDLIEPDAVPQSSVKFEPCYGSVVRTVNYPRAQRKPAFAFEKSEYLKIGDLELLGEHFIPELQATQIGSAPFFNQGDPELPGRMLCTISSVQQNLWTSYPWINQADPLAPEGEWRKLKNLMIGDVGCLFISIDESEKLHWAYDF